MVAARRRYMVHVAVLKKTVSSKACKDDKRWIAMSMDVMQVMFVIPTVLKAEF